MKDFEIEFDISLTYIRPLYFKALEDVEIRLLLKGNVSKVLIRIENSSGLWSNIEMKKGPKYYTATVKALLEKEKQHFYFVIFSDKEVWYHGQKGTSTTYPNKKDSFFIVSGLKVPSWVASSTCYQIFPDRFNNGDKSNDVKDGEYSFDGGIVSSHGFDEIPDEFEKSRCLDFFNGDLKGIEDKIEYFKRLGITCLYLNPINSSLTVHRYDSIDFFSVDKKLGGDEALISLIEKCHENGIRVVVDISINHTGSLNPWFLKAKEDRTGKEAGYYYQDGDNFRYWANVKTLPQLNYNSSSLRELIYKGDESVMKKYLNPPFNQDGWRLDVAPEVGRTETQNLSYEIWKEVNDNLKTLKEDVYLVGEDWNDASAYLNGDMWDGCMNYFGSGRVLRRWMGEKDRFLASAWGHDPGQMRAYTADEVVDGFIASNNSNPGQMNYFQMNLIDSHDTPRLQNHKDIYDVGIYKGVIIALYFLKGMPSTYYGNEIDLDGRMGTVEGSRYPMNWNEESWDKDLFDFFAEIGRIRKEYLSGMSFSAVKYFPLSDNAFAIYRYDEEKGLLAVINKSEKRTVLDLESILFENVEIEKLYGNSQIQTDGNNIELILDPFECSILRLSYNN